MTQRWRHLLFAHWPLPEEAIRPLLPTPLRPFLEIFDGSAWVGVIPFWMSHVRPRWMPPIPSAARFAELNVRTYVNVNGVRGVYFFSLDAESWLAVQAARHSYHLNYQYARMSVKIDEGEKVTYSSYRCGKCRAELETRYRPAGPAFHPQPGTVEDFLTGRYCLYTSRRGTPYRANIHHLPWTLQAAEAELMRNTMAEASGILLPAATPLLHFAAQMDVLVWLPKRLLL